MIILIDAYNVIRFLQPGRPGAGDAHQAWFLHKLAAYRQEKRATIEDLIVVFDGGLFSHRTREVTRGVVVVHAGVKRTADDVLVHYAQELGPRALLVSNDRELARRVSAHRAAVIGVQEFWSLVQTVTAPVASSATRWGAVEIVKHIEAAPDYVAYELSEQDLDELMIAGSVGDGGHKQDEEEERRRSGVTLSKKEKAAARLRKKLG